MGKEAKWGIMAQRDIFSTPHEWKQARILMQQRIREGYQPPFKIKKDNKELHHSFLVARDEKGKSVLGVVARSDGKEGILGRGDFGVCKLVLWEDGSMNALKVEPDSPGNYEIELMKKLGLIRAMFKRSWQQRTKEAQALESEPSEEWIKEKKIYSKSYKVIPLVRGVNLNNYLSSMDKDLSCSLRLAIAVSLVKELIKLHESGGKGIVHNDLHLMNVMIDKDLNVKIIDFGKSIDLSKIPTKFASLINMFGRLDIVAPEMRKFKEKLLITAQELGPDKIKQLDFDMPITPACDVYSLGVILEPILGLIGYHPIFKKMCDEMKKPDPAARPSLKAILKQLESPFIKDLANQWDGKKGESQEGVTPLEASYGTSYDLEEEIQEPEEKDRSTQPKKPKPE